MANNQKDPVRRGIRQRALLAAIESGITTTRALGAAADIRSTSVVAHELRALADQGKVVLEHTSAGDRVFSGRDYAAGWNAACRAAGNPNA